MIMQQMKGNHMQINIRGIHKGIKQSSSEDVMRSED